MVRLADVGPVAAGFWRLALAVPFLAFLAWRQGRGRAVPGLGADRRRSPLGGLFFAADLAAWHEGILRTKLANATLFGNFASFLFAIYGFVLLRALPRPVQGLALLLAAVGTALLLGSSYEAFAATHFTGDLLALARRPLLHLLSDRGGPGAPDDDALAGARHRHRRRRAAAPRLRLWRSASGSMPGDWTPVILLSISSQLIGQGLLVYAMGHLSPVVVGLCFLTQPIASAAIGWLAYDERLSAGRRRRRAADLRRAGADPRCPTESLQPLGAEAH